MTRIHAQILAEYRDADYNRRLHMYLQFPRLRAKFILIDRNDLKTTDLSAGFRWHRNPLAAQMSVLLSSVAGGVKKLFGMASA